jgi:hypothetical protein
MYWVYTCRIPTTTENSQLRVFELPAPAARSFVSVAHPPCFRHLRRRQTSCLPPPPCGIPAPGQNCPGVHNFASSRKNVLLCILVGFRILPATILIHSHHLCERWYRNLKIPQSRQRTMRRWINLVSSTKKIYRRLLARAENSTVGRHRSAGLWTGLGWTPCKIQLEPTKHLTHSYCLILDAP